MMFRLPSPAGGLAVASDRTRECRSRSFISYAHAYTVSDYRCAQLALAYRAWHSLFPQTLVDLSYLSSTYDLHAIWTLLRRIVHAVRPVMTQADSPLVHIRFIASRFSDVDTVLHSRVSSHRIHVHLFPLYPHGPWYHHPSLRAQ